MKQHNEFDDFLRNKEEEFNVPFREEYWEQAAAYIQASRVSTWTKFFRSPLFWAGTLAVLIGGATTLYFLNKPADLNVSSDQYVSEQPITHNTAKSGTADHIKDNVAGSAEDVNSQNEANPNDHKSGNATTGIISTSENNESNRTQSINTSNPPKKTIELKATSSTTKSNIQSTSQAIQNTGSDIISTRSENVYLTSIAGKLNPVFANSGIPSLPVYEHMTIEDNTIPVFYGLPYIGKSQGSTSRKIREFNRGGMFPQFTLSVCGGLNVFNTLKDRNDTSGFINSNPYLGIRTSYQFNTKWIATAQLNAIQRGGMNQRIQPTENIQDDILIRQFYALQLPVSVGYFLNKKHSISIGVAPMYALATSQSTFDQTTGETGNNIKIRNADELNRLDVQALIAYSYRLNKKINLNASYQHGFIDVTKSNVFTNELNHYNNFLSIGISYNMMQEKVRRR